MDRGPKRVKYMTKALVGLAQQADARRLLPFLRDGVNYPVAWHLLHGDTEVRLRLVGPEGLLAEITLDIVLFNRLPEADRND